MFSKRLNEIIEYVDQDAKMADIGCDHGYLAILAINKGIKRIQLVDNKKNPLLIAQKNLQKYQENAFLTFTLADGLSQTDDDIDTICICGMGGDLIFNIIKKHLPIAQKMHYLILEANSKVAYLRQMLSITGFKIIEEKLVLDKNHYYQIMKVKYDGIKHQLSEKECLFGPIILQKRELVFTEYLKKEKAKIDKIIASNIDKNDLITLQNKKHLIEEILNETI